ncbi:MAG: helix-turn-helix transcriptional regulator [Planctomycetes bacterium]|nr:helix-turn-helix transcriptional regulator [Planctomycetota bacterium]
MARLTPLAVAASPVVSCQRLGDASPSASSGSHGVGVERADERALAPTHNRRHPGQSRWQPLAKTSGVTAQAISKIEQGNRDPSWSTVVKLAHARHLRCRLRRLISDEEDDKPGDELPTTSAKKPSLKKPKR